MIEIVGGIGLFGAFMLATVCASEFGDALARYTLRLQEIRHRGNPR